MHSQRLLMLDSFLVELVSFIAGYLEALLRFVNTMREWDLYL